MTYLEECEGELVLYAVFQPYLVIHVYGGQFQQLEVQLVSASELATYL